MQQCNPVHVSVVVPCRNEIRHIRAFLDCVFRQELDGIEMEVLIADGRSDDGTREVLAEFEKKFAALRVLDNPERIVSTALNRAIREANSEIVICMIVHSTYAPDYVRSCIEVLHETKADNVGGPALTLANGYIAQAIAHAFLTPFARGNGKFRDLRYEGPVDTVPYGCWRKSTLERIGSFDETLVRAEDYELNVRIVSGGGTVWQSPRIVSWYWPRASLSALFRQYFQYGFWKAVIVRKHRRIVSWSNLVPSLSLLAGIVLLLCAATASIGGSVWWRKQFLDLWFVLAGFYFLASFVSAFSIARRNGWRFLFFLPIVFAFYHSAFAFGSVLAPLYCPTAGDPPNSAREILMAITR